MLPVPPVKAEAVYLLLVLPVIKNPPLLTCVNIPVPFPTYSKYKLGFELEYYNIG